MADRSSGLDLRALQQRFFALVTAREDVEAALPRLGLDAAALEALAPGDARLDAVGRIDIYNGMYFFRLLDVVRDDFGALAQALREDDFRTLVADYLESFPPRDHALRDLGRALPGFLGDHALGRTAPWLVDLARLEWARADVFDRADAVPLVHADLAALAPERFAMLPLRAIPAAALVDVRFAVDELWRQWSEGDADVHLAPPGVAPGTLLVWRAGHEVRHRRLGPVEGGVVPVTTATSFGAVCDRLGDGRDVDAAARLAFELLTAWMRDGLLRRPAA